MKIRGFIFSFFVLAFGISLSAAQAPDQESKKQDEKKELSIPSIDDKTKSMQRHNGLMPFYWDEKTGKIWIEIRDFESEFLYANSLATGLGSNPVGLDRGKLGSQKVVHFRRVGPKVLMVQRNLKFRARTDNEAERRAVEQSFAQSIVWGGKVAAEQDGRVLVDFTGQLMKDVQGIAGTLSRTGQGDFSVDADRSAIYLPNCKAFPKNTELEATLTFKGKKPGSHVQQTAPTADSVTLRQRHSFIELPDANYRPRRYDVRCPSMAISFADYAAPIDASIQKRWILRHRLVKKNPDAAISEPVEPIVYYVDAGAPPLIQKALVEGASWWNDAFVAAGFKNAFQVKVLPADADPLDVRYNVIQWVHRSTRGWSYGGSVSDPRTGEIIKGHVTLGSLRVRQDRLIFEGLQSGLADIGSDQPDLAQCGMSEMPGASAILPLAKQDSVQIALARIRQLSAHEVGHTLGFVHNFAASTYDDRASVMDYPAPRVKVTEDDRLDFSDAYAVGIGSWDKISVRYAYTQFSKGADEKKELNKILEEAANKKMLFISDSDARPASASHPLSNLWDNGTDPIKELEHLMRVRKIALKNFDPSQLPEGTTKAEIEQYLVPIFLYHRYQIQAVGKMIGGAYYEYGYAKGATDVKPVSGEQQVAALNKLLDCIDPGELIFRKAIAMEINPDPVRTIRRAENFSTRTGRDFDRFEPARVNIDLVFDELLNVQRLNRLDATSKLSPRIYLASICQRLLSSDFEKTFDELRVDRMIRLQLAERLMKVADHRSSSADVAAAALEALGNCQGTLAKRLVDGPKDALAKDRDDGAFESMLNRRIEQFLKRPHPEATDPETPTVPPGSPIGGK